jgi:site-specific recombinase XerD
MLHYGLLMHTDPTLLTLLPSYELHLRGQRKSRKTILAYSGAIRKLADVIGDKPVAQVLKQDLDGFIARIASGGVYSSSSLNNYVRSLRPFFGWLLAEGEIDADPMLRIRTPKPDDKVVPVPSDDDLAAILSAIGERRTDFVARRDRAIVRLFMATGIRRGELAGMRVDDVDLERGVIRVFGKGRRERIVGISGDKAVSALDRYLRVRQVHAFAHSEYLWLGEKGALTSEGVYQMLRRRARQAGVKLHPHQFRHWYAHQFLAAGGQEGNLQVSAGWASRQMLGRYGASAGSARAMSESRRLALSDRV